MLLDSRQVAEMLGGAKPLSPGAAAKLMDEWGVPFVSLGVGRGRGRRWRLDLVQTAILEREHDPKSKTTKKPATRRAQAISTMSALDFARALTTARPLH